MESDHVHAPSLVSPAAHYHNWLDAGRFAASILMLIALYHFWQNPKGASDGWCCVRAWHSCCYLAFPIVSTALYVAVFGVFSPLAAIGLGCIPAIWQKRIFVLVSDSLIRPNRPLDDERHRPPGE